MIRIGLVVFVVITCLSAGYATDEAMTQMVSNRHAKLAQVGR